MYLQDNKKIMSFDVTPRYHDEKTPRPLDKILPHKFKYFKWNINIKDLLDLNRVLLFFQHIEDQQKLLTINRLI